jgi:hypothetical protein
MRNSVIVTSIVALGLSIGARNANADRVVTADETNDPGAMTFATDSGLVSPANPTGAVCATANEDITACFGTAYNVSSNLIGSTFRANGGTFGVNLCNVLGASCSLDGRNTANTISDQLWLQVGAQNAAAGTNSLLWCWDSDLEPNINICQDQITVANPIQVLEPAAGFIDLTQFFTGPSGPLAAGQWTIRAESEVPEPSSLFLVAMGLAVGALCLRKRRVFQPNDLPEAPQQNH